MFLRCLALNPDHSENEEKNHSTIDVYFLVTPRPKNIDATKLVTDIANDINKFLQQSEKNKDAMTASYCEHNQLTAKGFDPDYFSHGELLPTICIRIKKSVGNQEDLFTEMQKEEYATILKKYDLDVKKSIDKYSSIIHGVCLAPDTSRVSSQGFYATKNTSSEETKTSTQQPRAESPVFR